MDSKKLTTLIITFAILLTACSKKAFKIDFALPESVNDNFTAIFYASDKRGGMTMETVALINQGKGSLTCPAVNPTILYLYPGKNRNIVIFAEKGDKIKVTGTTDNPYSWTVDGNDINRDLSAWRNSNAKTLIKDNADSTNLAVARYVYSHPDSQVSPILLLTSFDRSADETLFRRLWFSLGAEADARKWARIVSRADIPDGTVRTPGKLRSLVLRSLANGVDTIRPDSVKATLLFFWNNGMPDRRENFDSIKSLSRQYPDSASRIIADICMDADSISWRSPLRGDSLEKVVRMWTPAGMADHRLMGLGVSQSPFYIVVSPDGNQAYRGTDRDKAFAAFRKLADRKSPDKEKTGASR